MEFLADIFCFYSHSHFFWWMGKFPLKQFLNLKFVKYPHHSHLEEKGEKRTWARLKSWINDSPKDICWYSYIPWFLRIKIRKILQDEIQKRTNRLTTLNSSETTTLDRQNKGRISISSPLAGFQTAKNWSIFWT